MWQAGRVSTDLAASYYEGISSSPTSCSGAVVLKIHSRLSSALRANIKPVIWSSRCFYAAGGSFCVWPCTLITCIASATIMLFSVDFLFVLLVTCLMCFYWGNFIFLPLVIMLSQAIMNPDIVFLYNILHGWKIMYCVGHRCGLGRTPGEAGRVLWLPFLRRHLSSVFISNTNDKHTYFIWAHSRVLAPSRNSHTPHCLTYTFKKLHWSNFPSGVGINFRVSPQCIIS